MVNVLIEIMMKKYIHYLPIVIALFVLNSCMSSYSKYPHINKIEDLAYPFDTKKITLKNGISIAYTEQGQGKETILFIHGLASYMPAWKKNIEVLSKTYRCIAIDLPGYGKSSKGAYECSMDFFATSIKEMMDSKGISSYYVAGHSMGGQISMVMALKYPNTVKGLILTAPAGFETFTEGEKQWFREAVTAKATYLTPVEQIQTNFGSNFNALPADAEFMITDRIAMRDASDFEAFCYVIPQSVQGMVNSPVYDELPKIKQPCVVIFGENDNLIPNRYLHGGTTLKIAQQGASRLPNCKKVVMIPNAGHFVQWEGADLFNQSVLEFVK